MIFDILWFFYLRHNWLFVWYADVFSKTKVKTEIFGYTKFFFKREGPSCMFSQNDDFSSEIRRKSAYEDLAVVPACTVYSQLIIVCYEIHKIQLTYWYVCTDWLWYFALWSYCTVDRYRKIHSFKNPLNITYCTVNHIKIWKLL